MLVPHGQVCLMTGAMQFLSWGGAVSHNRCCVGLPWVCVVLVSWLGVLSHGK